MGKRGICRTMGIVAGALFFLVCSPGRGENRLEAYRRTLGSSLEKDILVYARSCILRALDPSAPVPTELEGTEDLPPIGMVLSLMREREVRACVGGFSPPAPTLKKAIGRLAGDVTYYDIRQRPLSSEEMKTLSLVISFIGPVREIRDPYALDFSEEGLCITQEERSVMLLPGETKTLDYGIRKLLRQNNLNPEGPVRYSAFKVVAFDERRWSWQKGP